MYESIFLEQLLQNTNNNIRPQGTSENHKHQVMIQQQKEEQVPVPGYVIWACATGGLDLERKMKPRKPYTTCLSKSF